MIQGKFQDKALWDKKSLNPPLNLFWVGHLLLSTRPALKYDLYHQWYSIWNNQFFLCKWFSSVEDSFWVRVGVLLHLGFVPLPFPLALTVFPAFSSSEFSETEGKDLMFQSLSLSAHCPAMVFSICFHLLQEEAFLLMVEECADLNIEECH